MPKYKIMIQKSRAKRQWDHYEEIYPEKMCDIKKFLLENPNDRRKAIGRLKKLHGKLNGTLQYDISDRDRIWYKIDSDKKIVYVEYIGPHP